VLSKLRFSHFTLFSARYLPLWLCLFCTIVVRTWFVLHNHGIVEGDEALVGIQAEHILHGEHPIYFYTETSTHACCAPIRICIFHCFHFLYL